MTNKEIATNIAQIAKILELRGTEKNRFRIVAYERAAETIANYPEDMRLVYEKGGLKGLNDIEGVGESIAEKIEELIKTDKLAYLKELQEDIPAAEVEFLAIPGVGPKMAVKLAEELKAKNIEDLKKKLEKGEGEKIILDKTRENILQGIEILGKLTDRLLITEALPIAEDIVKKLTELKETKKVDYVGSLRRMKDTIGDIDIVATSSEPKKVIDQFVQMSFVDHIVTQGETKSTIIHRQGVQIDLEIVPSEEYGSLLQHFTGSKDHNVALRTYAQTQNKSVSEHGIKYSGSLHQFDTESGVYGFLGMDYIEPELRENRGEIEAALKKQLPNLLNIHDIKGDLHVHSNWSDGNLSILEIAQIAEKMGYEYISITDHTVGLGIAHGLSGDSFLARQKEIGKAQQNVKIKILSGAEVNIKADGDLDVPDDVLEKLDVVVGSVHSSFRQDKETMTERLLKAINHPHIDIIGHPSGRLIGQREPYEVDWAQIFENCAKTGTALEISSFPNRLDLADYLVQEAKRHGCKFTIDTDSHQMEHLELMRYGISVARRGWCEASDILNTQGLNELQKWLRR